MKSTPYWLDTSLQGPDRSATELGGHVDVAVVGAGLTGLSAALHLARKGAQVAVLERDTVAFGASGRNGGMATTGLSIGFRDAIARYGFPTASALFLAYNDAIDSVEKLVGDEGIDCDFARTGKLTLAPSPATTTGFGGHTRYWPSGSATRRTWSPSERSVRRSPATATTARWWIPRVRACTSASSPAVWERPQ